MQYTEAEIAWFQQQKATGQYTDDQLIAHIMQCRQTQPAPVATPAPVAQVTQVTQVVQPAQDLSLYRELAELAAEDEDHTTTNSGSLPAAGGCWIRFLNFIEIGVHPSKNKTHKPSQVAIVTVELHTPAHMHEQNGIQVPHTLDIRIPKSQGVNSRWPKFVKAVQRALLPSLGYEITHMSQAIGHGCLGTVYHNSDGDKTYANLDIDKAWSFQPAKYLDQASQQMVEVNIPPLHGTPAVFMMNNQKILAIPEQVKFMWDSIFIDGTYEKEVNGVKQQISRNFFQKQIAKSIGWEQSPIKRILDQQGCTTTFGESTPAAPQQSALPSNLAAQVQQMPTSTPAQAMPANIPAELPQQVANPIVGNPSAGVETMPAMQTTTAVSVGSIPHTAQSTTNVNAAPAGMVGGMPTLAQPVATQQTPANMNGTGVPPMNAAAFMNQFAPQ